MRNFLIVALSLALAAVTGTAQENSMAAPPTRPASLGASAPSPNGVASARNRIAPGDFLTINVFDVPELTQETRVDDKGDAVLTLLGSLHLAGMTTTDAQTLIQDRLRQGNYILEPRVSILIREYASFTAGGALNGTQGVSVFGEVTKPGVYPLLGTRTLLDVISDAGGTTPLAARQATVKRHATGEVLHATLTSTNPTDLLDGNLELQVGDTVIVPKAGIVYIVGDVGRPGGFAIQDEGKLSLLQLLALGGGPNRTAALSHAKFLRKTPTGLQEEDVNLKKILEGKQSDVALNVDDILFVPSSRVKTMMATTPQALLQSAAGAAIYTGIAYH